MQILATAFLLCR